MRVRGFKDKPNTKDKETTTRIKQVRIKRTEVTGVNTTNKT